MQDQARLSFTVEQKRINITSKKQEDTTGHIPIQSHVENKISVTRTIYTTLLNIY